MTLPRLQQLSQFTAKALSGLGPRLASSGTPSRPPTRAGMRADIRARAHGNTAGAQAEPAAVAGAAGNAKPAPRSRWLPAAVLFASLTLTAIAWYASSTVAHTEARAQFESATEHVAAITRQQLLSDEVIVRGGAALLPSPGTPSHQDWRRYALKLDLEERVPALKSLGFTPQPSADPSLRAGMQRARDSGATTLAFPSGKPPSPAPSRDPQTAPSARSESILYVPVYEGTSPPASVAKRRANIRGYLFGVIDEKELVRGASQSVAANMTCQIRPTATTRPAATPTSPDATSGASFNTANSATVAPRTPANSTAVTSPGAVAPRTPANSAAVTSPGAVAPRMPANSTAAASSAPAPAYSASQELGPPASGSTIECESNQPAGAQSNRPQLVLATGIPVSLLLFVVAFAFTTTRQRAQRFAEQITVNLRQAAEERRREEANLRQSQKLEAISTLSRGIANELGDSIEEILEQGDLLRSAAAPESLLRGPIEKVVGAGLRARSAVERIIAFSRGGIGERIAMHAQSLVSQILEDVSDSLPAGVRLDKELHGGDAAIVGDPRQIQQIITSLCSNALDAMRAGGVLAIYLDLVSLEGSRTYATATALPGDYVRLRVRDSGAGIAPELIERIFDPYFTSRGTGVATGLGLTLVQSIANDLGGAVDVHSDVGRGTTVSVLIPRYGNMPPSHSSRITLPHFRLNRDPHPAPRATPMH